MPSPSRNSLLLLLVPVALAACGPSAPPLPPDTTSVNRTQELRREDFNAETLALSCDQLSAERRKVSQAIGRANKQIEASHGANQASAYLMGLGIPSYINGNYTERTAIAQLYARQDQLIRLQTLQRCQG